MTSEESRGKNNSEFRRLMLAGALSMSPELAALCDRFETATIEELDAALGGGDVRSRQLYNRIERGSTVAAPEQPRLTAIAMPAVTLLASTADVGSPPHQPEARVGTLDPEIESPILESRIDDAESRSSAPALVLPKTGIAVSELRRAVVTIEGRPPEALPTRFARAISLIRSQFLGPGAVLPSG